MSECKKLFLIFRLGCSKIRIKLKHVLIQFTKEQVKKAGGIKAIFLNADGVLTDGRLMYDETGKEIRAFHVTDAFIVNALRKAGIIVGIISGRDSKAVSHLAADLKLDFCHQGIVDKLSVFEKLTGFHKLRKKQVAYIGYDADDLAVLAACGLSVCAADALSYVKAKTDVITRTKSGEGVLREVADLVLSARGELEKRLKE